MAPTEHGLDPILAVHDPGLVRFLEEAWPQARREGIVRAALMPDTLAVRGLIEGLGPESERLLREPSAIAGRAGFWGLDSSTPIVAGTYGAARGAVDAALTTVDLVLDGGETTAYGLCRPPGHHAARSMYAGYCFFNNAAIAAESIARRTGERVAILDLDYHHGNGTQQIFWRRGDVLYVSLHADPDRQYPYFLGRADETGRGSGRRGEPATSRSRPASTTRRYLACWTGRSRRSPRAPGSVIVVSLGFDTLRPRPDLRLRPHHARLPRDRPPGRRARAAAGDPPGGRLPPPDARRERPDLAARCRGPSARPRAAAAGAAPGRVPDRAGGRADDGVPNRRYHRRRRGDR